MHINYMLQKKKKEGSEFFSDTLVSAERSFAHLILFLFQYFKSFAWEPMAHKTQQKRLHHT